MSNIDFPWKSFKETDFPSAPINLKFGADLPISGASAGGSGAGSGGDVSSGAGSGEDGGSPGGGVGLSGGGADAVGVGVLGGDIGTPGAGVGVLQLAGIRANRRREQITAAAVFNFIY